MIGQTISHYKILEKLGEGGMGVVYKAQDTKLDRLVALKFLPPHLSASEQDKARFIQEAKSASAINHPNICTIYSIDEHDQQMFIAMEYVDGQTLGEKLKSQIPNRKSAIDIGIQIAEGLAAAHEKGIVHRDIKPDNIMVRKDGIVQIMDFGLAKLRASGSKITPLTKEGSTVGTAGYMSPEQVQGQDADHRSDIFSLGVLLYELFTGQLPFRSVHETALLYEIVNVDPAPMSATNQEIDPELDRIVLECLQKEPSERHQSVAEVSKDLKRFKRESGRKGISRVTAARPSLRAPGINQPAVSHGSEKRRILWPTIATVLAILLVASVWGLWQKSSVKETSLRLSISLPKDQTIETESFSALAISPDGTRIVYRAGRKLHQRRLDSFDAEPIAGTEDGSSPFFSPDGRWIGFFATGKLKKVALSGGSPVVIADMMADNRGAAWSSDGTIVFAPRGSSGLFRVNADGGEVQPVTMLDSTRNERTHRWPHLLPEGETVIFTIGTMDSPDYYDDASIGSVNIRTGERKVLISGASTARCVSANFLVYSHTGDLFAAPFDIGEVKVKGPSFPVISSVSGDQTTGATNYAISDNGTLVYAPGLIGGSKSRELAIVDLSGATSVLPLPVDHYLEPRISPDGKRVAVVVGSAKDFDVWLYNIPLNAMNRFTFGGVNRTPVWSPDGSRIAYSDNTPGKLAVVIRRSDGTGTPETIPMEHRTYVNTWSRDGSTLVISAPIPGAGWNLYVLPLVGERRIWAWNETNFNELQGELSPDGKWLSYTYSEGGVQQIYVRPFPRGEARWQISTAQAFESHWFPRGTGLYITTLDGIVAVPITATQSIAVGRSRIVLKDYRRLPVESNMTFDVSPDGKYIIATRPMEGAHTASQINVVTNWFNDIQKTLSSSR